MTSGNLKLGFAICDLLSGGLGRKCGYLLTSTDDKAKLSPRTCSPRVGHHRDLLFAARWWDGHFTQAEGRLRVSRHICWIDDASQKAYL